MPSSFAPATSWKSESPTKSAWSGAQPRAGERLLEDPRRRLARARALARQHGVEVAAHTGDLEQVVELVVVDVRHHADVQPAPAQLGQRLAHQRPQREVAPMALPLEAAVLPEQRFVGRRVELRQHAAHRVAEQIAVEVEARSR